MIQREISDKRFKVDSLDGLRGFAALIVVFSHTSNAGMYFVPFLDLRGIGKSGVFLFFLLSAFLLTLPLLQKGKEIISFPVMSHYWQRRFFRIYPLYTLYLLLSVLTTWLLSTFFGRIGIGIPFSLDWQGFFNHLILQEGKGITWSIAVEFKFYFILPLFAMVMFFVSSYGAFSIIVFFLVLLFLSQVIFPQSQSVTNDPRLLPYMPIFLIGMFLAFLQNYTTSKSSHLACFTKVYKYLGYVGAAGIIIMTPLIYSLFGNKVPGNYFHKQFILYALFWSLVLLSAINVRGIIQRFFMLPILRFYGALSFSIYLFHPIFIILVPIFKLNGYLGAWFVLFSSTVLSCVSFKLLEGPLSKYTIPRNTLSSIFKYKPHFSQKALKNRVNK